MQELRQHPYQIPPYLRFTPINMDAQDRYDYDRSDLYAKLQYYATFSFSSLITIPLQYL